MSQQQGQQEEYSKDQGIPPKPDVLQPPGHIQLQPGYHSEYQPQPIPSYPSGYQPEYQPGYTGQLQQGYQPGYPGQSQQGYQPGFPQGSQQVATTVTVVTQQPAHTDTGLPRSFLFGRTKNFYFTESVMLTLVLCIFGGYPALCCTVPAIFLSLSAQKAHAAGNTAGAINKATTAHHLIVAALVYAIVGGVFFVVVIPIAAPIAFVVTAVSYS